MSSKFRIMIEIVFVDMLASPDKAAAALQRAGYSVARVPDSFVLEEPLDDFIQAFCELDGPADTEMLGRTQDTVEAIVQMHGGHVSDCAIVGKNYTPFANFGPNPPVHPDTAALLTSLGSK